MVQHIERLGNELEPCPFRETNGTRYARVERDDGGQVEGIASETRRPLVPAVAIAIEIAVDQRGIGLSALGVEYPGNLPTFGQSLENVVLDALRVVQVPHS